MSIKKPDVDNILRGLKDFQRNTVEYVFDRLYGPVSVNRFLIADEVGLGKTLIAKGVVAKAIDHLWNDHARRIDIVYICANRDIAAQNIARLNVTEQEGIALASRLTLLPIHTETMDERLNFVSFTPGTSFDLLSKGGIMKERALIYRMLRDGWDMKGASLRNLLQSEAGVDSWKWYIDRLDSEIAAKKVKINSNLAHLYLEELEKEKLQQRVKDLMERFPRCKQKQNVPYEDRQKRNALIGDLRRILARSCLSALQPDLIILDEFQRFKNLLEGEDEVAKLAHELFNYEGAKVLLLSATPYKMYTMTHETEEDDHYRDFLRTVEFLFQSKQETAEFELDLEKYRKALYEVGIKGIDHLKSAKEIIEKKLRRVMARTERLAVTIDRDGMIEDSPLGNYNLMPQDLNAFKMIDQIARLLDVSDTVEYWKSAPYLLNFMDKNAYKIKRKFAEDIGNGKIQPKAARILEEAQESLISWNAIQKYQKVDPLNAKLRMLLANTVEKKAWQLLWIPPSLPYYQAPCGPFEEEELKDFTKALVFSSWQVVPKVIATLCSYNAEKNVMNALDKPSDYTSKRSRLIEFSTSEGELRGMRFFSLIYPCITLATSIDPMQICSELASEKGIPSMEKVMTVVKDKIKDLLKPVIEDLTQNNLIQSAEVQRADQSWYVAGLALIDRYYQEKTVRLWRAHQDKDEDEMNWASMLSSRQEDGESRFDMHINRFWDYFDHKVPLGMQPDDLIDILAKAALASPAVVALRSFCRLFSKEHIVSHGDISMSSAASVAMGFRSLFNLPDTIALLRSIGRGEDERYWEEVLDYCSNGNLQSVMDEYVHILRESLGQMDKPIGTAVPKIAEEIATAVSLRTASLDFDNIKIKDRQVELKKETLRCRFALRYGNDKDEDGEETRADQVRKSFNSPFRPFILASTSVGQEGLDFHHYCHSIYHWNLPANPVDLEQREGRIHRYKGHVIRRNIACGVPLHLLANRLQPFDDPWNELFKMASEMARKARPEGQNELVPYWIFEVEGGFKIRRFVPYFPLSREQNQLFRLKQTLAAYRMVFGQPRQEDLVAYLRSRLDRDLSIEELLMFKIDLQPVIK